jgi:hypothetical protein
VNIVQGGITIETFPLFIAKYREAGGTTIGNVAGENIIGTLNRYSTVRFKETGRTGKRKNIGRSIIPGTFKVGESSQMGENIRKQARSSNKRTGEGTKITTIVVVEISGTTETTTSNPGETKIGRVPRLKILL